MSTPNSVNACDRQRSPKPKGSPDVSLAPRRECSARQLQARISRAARAQQYATAISLLNQLIRQFPNRADYYGHRGLMYYRCRQWVHAMTDFNQALALNSCCDRTYNYRANCYAAQRSWLEAMADYDRAIDLNPFNTRARLNQGIALRVMAEYDAALVCFDVALFFGSLEPAIYAERGRTYHLMGHWNCAMGDYCRALQTLSSTAQADSLKEKIHQWQLQLLTLTQHQLGFSA